MFPKVDPALYPISAKLIEEVRSAVIGTEGDGPAPADPLLPTKKDPNSAVEQLRNAIREEINCDSYPDLIKKQHHASPEWPDCHLSRWAVVLDYRRTLVTTTENIS